MHEALKLIVASFPPPGPLYERLELDNRDGLPMDLASRNATIVLRQIGREAELQPFFTE
jgi:hypothetical protein